MTIDPGDDALVPLGEGPAGTVFAGTDPVTGAAYALKVLSAPLDGRTRRRVEAELATLVRLRGRAPILVADRLERRPDGRWALRMELCTQNLTELVDTAGPLPAAEVAELGVALAGALAVAHRAGLVHGGVTPGNVLFRPSGEPVLSDFGLALRSDTPDERADLRGLGAVLRLASAGHADPPAGTRHQNPAAGTPPALAGLIRELLDPACGPIDAATVARRLEEGDDTPAVRLPAGRPILEFGPEDPHRRRRIVAAGVAVASVLAGVTAWVARPDRSDLDAGPTPRAVLSPAGPSSGPAAQVALAEPVDRGTAVDLSWTGGAALEYAIIVTADGQQPRTVLAGPATSRRVPVDADRAYCFSVQGTDGRTVVQSAPRPIRGATC
jgi:hypothetical protein